MPTEQEYINYKDFVDSLDEATPSASDKAVFNDANGPKSSLYSVIANFVLDLWAAFVNALTAKTSFASGDKIPVVNGSTASAMEASKLLELTAQKALVENIAQVFDPTKPNDAGGYAYYENEYVVKDEVCYKFIFNHASGAWNADEAKVAEIGELLTKLNNSVYDEKSFTRNPTATKNGYYIGKTTGNLVSTETQLSVRMYPVSAGEVYKIVGSSQASSLAAVYAVYNTNDVDNVSSSTLVSLSSKKLDSVNYSLEVQIPASGAILAVSVYTGAGSVSVSQSEITDKIESLAEDVEDLDEVCFFEKLLPTNPNTISNKYIGGSGVITDFDGLNIKYIPVSAGEVYQVKGQNQAGIAKRYAVYSTNNPSLFAQDTCLSVSAKSIGADSGSYTESVTVPTGAQTLAVSVYPSGSVGISKVGRGDISEKIDALGSAHSFRYSVGSNSILVATKSGEKELVVKLATITGGNGLFDFRKFGKLNIGADIIEGNLSVLYSGATDWFAPFVVRATSNIDGDDVSGGVYNVTFTGGSHQYNNGISGSTPTARIADLKMRVNGELVTEGDSGYGANLEIKWTNYIQGYNTKKADGTGREILKENITLRYNGLEWTVETELVPLEDIVLELWYGYQMAGVNGTFIKHWKYVNGSTREADQDKSGNNKTKAVICYGGTCNLEMWLDESIDMGGRSFAYGSIDNSAFKSGEKLYFTIANNPYAGNMSANCSYYLFGKYRFELP